MPTLSFQFVRLEKRKGKCQLSLRVFSTRRFSQSFYPPPVYPMASRPAVRMLASSYSAIVASCGACLCSRVSRVGVVSRFSPFLPLSHSFSRENESTPGSTHFSREYSRVLSRVLTFKSKISHENLTKCEAIVASRGDSEPHYVRLKERLNVFCT